MKTYYQFVGGNLSGQILTAKEIEAIAYGRTKNLSKERSEGKLVHRAELDDQPTVQNYLGPMYNGRYKDGVLLRYETHEVYDMFFNQSKRPAGRLRELAHTH